ncbi:hypothetical protein [Novosphingobium sp. CF614]|uniref:hypothetical protein n=1 Tax=Novosphingobium sp. CF614 TaxID=1884364 RepID=UPI0015A6AD7D|nr:hypothetical protein [Novosphingobium sp. CF614]
MSGQRQRRRTGMWIAIAIALVAAFGLFKGVSSGSDQPRAREAEAAGGRGGTIVIRVLGPVLY